MTKKLEVSDEEIKRLYESGLSQRQIGDMLGVTAKCIQGRMKKARIQARSYSESSAFTLHPDEKTVEKIRTAYASGMSYRQLMDLGHSERLIRHCLDDTVRSRQQQADVVNERNEVKLTSSQRQVILGTLLGDGCLSRMGGSYALQINHGNLQKQYLQHKADRLPGDQKLRKRGPVGFAKLPGWRWSLQNKAALQRIADVVFVNGVKRVNQKWMDALEPEALAYWFMDDGSSTWVKDRPLVRIFTQSYDDREHDLLISMLARFGLDARKRKTKHGTKLLLAFPKKDGIQFMRLVEPFIRRVPSMTYKLKVPICHRPHHPMCRHPHRPKLPNFS